MSKYIGRLVQLGVAKESTRGAGASPSFHLPRTSMSFDDKVIKARSVGSLGKLEDSEEAFVTTKYGQGDLEGEIRSESFGLLLYAMLGAVSSSGISDSVYTHSFSLSHSNQHQSLGFVVVDGNNSELYKLVMLDSLEITAELDQVVRYSASFMSKQGVPTGLTVPAVADEYKFTKKHLSLKLASNIAGLSGATAISIKNLTLTISKNVMLDDVLGTAEPEDILNRQISVEGEFELNYEDETYKNYMKDGSVRAMEIAFNNYDELIGSSSTAQLKFQFPNVDFFDWEPSYDNDEIVKQKISFKASRDVANNADLISTCQLINETVSY